MKNRLQTKLRLVLISHIKHVQAYAYFSDSWDRTELWTFCKKVASLCIICRFLIYLCIHLGILISAVFCSNDWQLVECGALCSALFISTIDLQAITERSHFWITWWTVLMKKLIKIIFSKPNAHSLLPWIYALNRWPDTALNSFYSMTRQKLKWLSCSILRECLLEGG